MKWISSASNRRRASRVPASCTGGRSWMTSTFCSCSAAELKVRIPSVTKSKPFKRAMGGILLTAEDGECLPRACHSVTSSCFNSRATIWAVVPPQMALTPSDDINLLTTKLSSLGSRGGPLKMVAVRVCRTHIPTTVASSPGEPLHIFRQILLRARVSWWASPREATKRLAATEIFFHPQPKR